MDVHKNPNLKRTHEEFFIESTKEASDDNEMIGKASTVAGEVDKPERITHNHHGGLRTAPSTSLQNSKTTHEEFLIKITEEASDNNEVIGKASTVAGEVHTPERITHNHRRRRTASSTCAQDFKTTHQELFIKYTKEASDDYEAIGKASTAAEKVDTAEESGRERLKRHRIEMSGRVWIPDIWGQEDLLKNWLDCTLFDSSLGNSRILLAREALIQEGRSALTIENSC